MVNSGHYAPYSAPQPELYAQEIVINKQYLTLLDEPQEGPRRSERIKIKTLDGRPMSYRPSKLCFITDPVAMKKSKNTSKKSMS